MSLQEKQDGKSIFNKILRYIILIIGAIIMIYPMLWMVGASFMSSNAEIFSSIWFMPKSPTTSGYVEGWQGSNYPFGHFMLNTFKFVIPKVIGTVISATLTAYAFTRFEFKSRKILYAVMISTLFLPQVVMNVPQFILFTKLGWNDSYLPLIVPSFDEIRQSILNDITSLD